MLLFSWPYLRVIGLVAATSLLAAENVRADPVTFFGEDINLSGDPDTRIPHPNSDAAQASFLANLSGVQTETFEGFAPLSTSPLVVTFPDAGIATITGFGEVSSGNSGFGQYPISGDQFWLAPTGGDFVIEFSNPIAAFGFYGVDVGDNFETLGLV